MSKRTRTPSVNRAIKTTSKQPRFKTVEPSTFFTSILGWVNSLVECEPDYTANSLKRDKWLASIWREEPHLAGVLSSVVSIDTNRGWSLEGGRNQVMKYSTILHEWSAAPGVSGWRPGIASASTSYYSTDIGSIVELGRDGESGPLRGLYHVDPTRCMLNGSAEAPLTYFPTMPDAAQTAQDWKISDYLRMASMVSTFEAMNGLGYCAISRCIELTKLMVAIYEHDREELGARAPRGLLLLQGISENQWDDAMEGRKVKLDSEGYGYFDAVAVLASSGMDQIDAKIVALSQLPAGFDLQQFTGMLIYGYALCFGYDPSEFYPVQFGSLGRGTEMEVQHEKATGKGGLNFIFALQEQLQRPDVLPSSVRYELDQRDEQAEIIEAQVQEAWVNTFKSIRETGLAIDQTGGISRSEYRILLADHNIIPKEWTQVEEDTEVTDEEAPQSTALGKPEDITPLLMQSRQRRLLRDLLMSKPHIRSAIDRFPMDDIVRYKWPEHSVITVWETASSLLDRIMYPSVQRMSLYKSKDITITDEDVATALEEAEQINPTLHQILAAGQLTDKE